MRSMIKVLTVLLLTTVFASASPILYWGSPDGLDLGAGDVFDRNGILIPQDSDWLIEMVNVADDSVLISLNNGFMDGDGLFYVDAIDADGWNGLTVKTVIYDAPAKPSAGYVAEFPTQYTFSWGSPVPPNISDWNTGALAAGDWQVIPEPAVAGLIVIFGSGMLMSRRLFRKD